MIRIASARLSATISPRGAELQSLTDDKGRDLLWDGDPAVWAGRAPILFPIVGRLRDDRYRLDGRDHALPKHGFARVNTFDVLESSESSATLQLAASEATRAAYPFEFRLTLRFGLDDATLTMTAEVANDGDAAMPASFGFHPAFRWPLPGGARDAQTIRFEHPEHEAIRRIDRDGLLIARTFPSPIAGDTLALDDALFADDALILDGLWSRACTLAAPGAPSLRIEWPGMPMLGVWTKPGAGYICIEPWQGIADPVGDDGDFRAKPGIVEIAPGAARRFTMRVTVEG